jgi:D-glycero-D-manno-heptose 1,7-bisphosphate phosphatase
MKEISKYQNIFLDRDGVINQVIDRDSVISSPWSFSEFVIKKEFRNFYEKYKSKSFFVVTNQPDISRKNLKYSELEKMHSFLKEEFNFTEIIHCPHDNYHKCLCRKPKPGMILDLIHRYNLIKTESILIGDSDKDVLSGISAGIKTIFLQTNYNTNPYSKKTATVRSLNDL